MCRAWSRLDRAPLRHRHVRAEGAPLLAEWSAVGDVDADDLAAVATLIVGNCRLALERHGIGHEAALPFEGRPGVLHEVSVGNSTAQEDGIGGRLTFESGGSRGAYDFKVGRAEVAGIGSDQ